MPSQNEQPTSPPTESRSERLERLVEEAKRRGQQEPGSITITVPSKKGAPAASG